MGVDQDICERFRSGEENAFSEIVKKYEKLVFKICKVELESGKSDIHLKMLSGYKNVIEDIRSEVWISLLKQMKKGVEFDKEESLINLIRRITVLTTKTAKRKSIRNRNPAALSKSKGKAIKVVSNTFSSTDHKKYADKIDSMAIDGRSEMYLSEEEDLDFDRVYANISEKLSNRQQNLIRLIKSSLLKGEKAAHPYLAEELGVSERTVRNDLVNIRKMFNKLKP